MRRVVVAAGLLAGLGLVPLPAAAPAEHDVIVSAHRGGAAYAPENTMLAFQNAVRLGVDELETDVQQSGDGALVERRAVCDGADTTLAHPLRGEGITVPRLQDLLTFGRSIRQRLSIEIKNIPDESSFDPAGTTVAERLVPLLAGFPRDRLVIQSFFPTSLDAVKRLDPTLRTQFLTTTSIVLRRRHAQPAARTA